MAGGPVNCGRGPVNCGAAPVQVVQHPPHPTGIRRGRRSPELRREALAPAEDWGCAVASAKVEDSKTLPRTGGSPCFLPAGCITDQRSMSVCWNVETSKQGSVKVEVALF